MIPPDVSLMIKQSHGLVLDTNILIAKVIAMTDPSLIARSKAIADVIVPEDLPLIDAAIELARSLVTTPHILAECSNLLGRERPDVAAVARTTLITWVRGVLDERFQPLREVRRERWASYARLGFTDASIATLAVEGYVPFTEDFELLRAVNEREHCGLNLNYLRPSMER